MEAERRAEGEEFFKLVQEGVSMRAEEACAQRDQQIECLVEELNAAQGYMEGIRSLLAANEEGDEAAQEGWMLEGKVEEESREALVEGAVMCRELMEECETAVEQVQGLEQTVDELNGDEDRLVEEVCGLQHSIQELEVSLDAVSICVSHQCCFVPFISECSSIFTMRVFLGAAASIFFCSGSSSCPVA